MGVVSSREGIAVIKNMVGFRKGIGTTKVEALASVEAYHMGGQKLQTYIYITLKRKIRAPKAMSHSTLKLRVPRMAYLSHLSKTCGRAKMSTQLCSHIM